MSKEIFLYESHMGGYFLTDRELSNDELYCEQCGDSDYLVDIAYLDNIESVADTLEGVVAILQSNITEGELKYLKQRYIDLGGDEKVFTEALGLCIGDMEDRVNLIKKFL